jgi:hypothetical protein
MRSLDVKREKGINERIDETFFILIKGKFIEAIHDGLRVILFLKKKKNWIKS